jgi:hypothetical protein
VYSVCPHVKGNISFVFSTGRDGRIKAWLYDSAVAAVVDYSAEGGPPASIHARTHLYTVDTPNFDTWDDMLQSASWMVWPSKVPTDDDWCAYCPCCTCAGTWWTHMQYASDGVRLFACGVAAAGVGSTLVEWNESDGAIARSYAGFRNSGQNLARFDSLASRYLIAGDEGIVKVSARCGSTQGAQHQRSGL